MPGKILIVIIAALSLVAIILRRKLRRQSQVMKDLTGETKKQYEQKGGGEK